jgi:hypothetical protein
MSVTRDPSYPPEMAQLMQAFNAAADGHEPLTIVNASLQMMAAAIGFMAKQSGHQLENALGYADHVAGVMKKEIRQNWDRKPEPTDVPVRTS